MVKFLQLGDHLVALLDPGDSVVDELVDNLLGRLLLVDERSGLTHEEGAELVERVLAIIVATVAAVAALTHKLVEVSLVGDGALGGELLHLLHTVGLPLVDVRVVADTHRAACEDDCADVVVVAGSADGLLVSLGGTGLIG